ncbi:Response regulator [Pseudoalteromonas sp. 3J6]|jgi:response regulator RpfG family c-di-GMP phosphodiesterase|uniref:HD domain-containing phosphohydrolase n=1 Tax=unclassified Pseudoalteromonas TaxID=194690 RepID=UPI00110BA2CB|nr:MULTISPECIES: HD domain-containing phosphohydrolase [unclassified Pseudoalteromonas]MDN3486386.1 response regulator [Pseudoalteromonas sp. APC 3224]NWL17104.1 response regulator [Pseudoalteromonas sp. Scap03]QLE83150.1 response regulator [Pseudoalteromonas sp. Scap25]QLE91092.1 response regulator [Pseudoalteromonas sp. Scap06]TMP71929.1 two-component system response regulator [Pseudoalteromonas sp. S1609]
MTDIAQLEQLNQQPPSILCLDDEANVLKSLVRLLRQYKFDVSVSTNGQDALEKMQSKEFDVVISDMRMPHMSGAEFLAKARKLAPDSQRILLTGFSDLESTISAVNEGGIHAYVQKPWQNDHLVSVIQSGVEKFRLKKQNEILQQHVKSQNQQLKELNTNLEQLVDKRTNQIRSVLKKLEVANESEKREHQSTVELLYNFINANPYLDGKRAENIAGTCTQIARYLNVSQRSITLAPIAGYLAQIGLLAMDPELYNKPINELNEVQRKTFYTHPSISQLMLMPATHLSDVSDAIYHQFERYNGQGIPKGLAKNDIPIGAMVLSVARDYWEHYEQSDPLLTTKQRHEAALGNIKANSGSLYHPRIVDALEASHTKLITSDSSIGSIKIICAQELEENMTLANSLHSHTGIMLLPKEHVFNSKSIVKLQQLEAKKPTPFRIMVKTAK